MELLPKGIRHIDYYRAEINVNVSGHSFRWSKCCKSLEDAVSARETTLLSVEQFKTGNSETVLFECKTCGYELHADLVVIKEVIRFPDRCPKCSGSSLELPAKARALQLTG